MKRQLPIHDVLITELREIRDSRGSVLHMMQTGAAGFIGFGECYFSEVMPGAVKAWKRHRLQTQNLAVPIGQLRLVIYDDREESPTRNSLQVLKIGRPDAYLRVTIPPGLWYGFAAIGRTRALLVNCADQPHDPSESDSRSVDDVAIPFTWLDSTGALVE
jgi:dTDP-4-dehydrorhamnose 3,5-epimerase